MPAANFLDSFKPWGDLAQEFLQAQITLAKAATTAATQGLSAETGSALTDVAKQSAAQTLRTSALATRLVAQQATVLVDKLPAVDPTLPGAELLVSAQEKAAEVPQAVAGFLDRTADALSSVAAKGKRG